MHSRTMLALGVGLAAGGGAAAMLAAGDYERLPPKAAEVEGLIRGKEIRLGEAIRIAEKAAGGIAAAARYDLDDEAKQINVVVYAAGKEHRIRIDAEEGRVMSDQFKTRRSTPLRRF